MTSNPPVEDWGKLLSDVPTSFRFEMRKGTAHSTRARTRWVTERIASKRPSPESDERKDRFELSPEAVLSPMEHFSGRNKG